MAIYYLPPHPVFPDPSRDDVDELLAIGGDLRPERLLAAYRKGIFPWYSEESPILWWSPDPRLILPPESLHVPGRLLRFLRRGPFRVTRNEDFPGVIRSCAEVSRPGVRGTWIVPDMIEAYERLHRLGYAHSVEAWRDGDLAGGIYGVAIGAAFFGESMFYRVSGASKAALVALVAYLGQQGYHFMDCQQTTRHLQRFGAFEIPRKEFMRRLQRALAAGRPAGGTWEPGEIPMPECIPAGGGKPA